MFISTTEQQENKNMKILLCTKEWNNKNLGAKVRLCYQVKYMLLKITATDKNNILLKG